MPVVINELYLHHFRSFVNFTLTLGDSPCLLIGQNGSGKSSIGQALAVIKAFALSAERAAKVIGLENVHSGLNWLDDSQPTDAEDESSLVRLRLQLSDGPQNFRYSISLEWPEGFREPRVHGEELWMNHEPVFRRSRAEVDLVYSQQSFQVDWHYGAIPRIFDDRTDSPIEKFRTTIAKCHVYLEATTPATAGDLSDLTPGRPDEGEAFPEWLFHLFGEIPHSYKYFEQAATSLMPEFQQIVRSGTAKEARVIFAQGGVERQIPFGSLSDGEKDFLFYAALATKNTHQGPQVLVLDDVSSNAGLFELANLISMLRKAFNDQGQLIVSGHAGDLLRLFAREETYYIYSKNRTDPRQVKTLAAILAEEGAAMTDEELIREISYGILSDRLGEP